MNQSILTVRYAKAFFALAKEQDLIEPLLADMQLVLTVCRQSTDFTFLLENPAMRSSRKQEAVRGIFENRIHAHTLNFMLLLLENKRERYLPVIALDFMEMCRLHLDIREATITTAVELTDLLATKITVKLEQMYGGTVRLKRVLDQRIQGGFILRIDGQQLDASVATRLKEIRSALFKADVELYHPKSE